MYQTLNFLLLFIITLFSCNEPSSKQESSNYKVKKSSPVQKIDSLSPTEKCIDFQVGFDNEDVRIYIDDSLIINRIMNTQESTGLAYRLCIHENEGKYLKVNCTSSNVSDSFKIHDLFFFNGLRIDKKGKKIVWVKAKGHSCMISLLPAIFYIIQSFNKKVPLSYPFLAQASRLSRAWKVYKRTKPLCFKRCSGFLFSGES